MQTTSPSLASRTPIHLPPVLPGAEVPDLAGLLPRTSHPRVIDSQPAPTPEPVAELTPRAAFELLVSAACYLSAVPTTDTASSLDAVQLLHDLAEELRGSDLQLGTTPAEMEDLVWQSKQLRWERQRSVEAAIRFVKGMGPIQQVAPPRQRSGFWSRWREAWRSSPQVQPF